MTAPKYPFAETKITDGTKRLVRIWEDLRARNTDGYLAGVGGILANIKGHGSLAVCSGTTCSPFTATVVGVAFDKTYPRDDWPSWPTPPGKKAPGEPYEPMFNGGADPLPFAFFYGLHNRNDNQVNSVVYYNLAKEVDATEMRRGDLLEINWWSGGGHAVFCWDVHLDESGKVDAFQIIGSNGPAPGVGVWGLLGKPWFTGHNATGARGSGTLKAREGGLFKDGDDLVEQGFWLVLPKVAKIDTATFRKKPKMVLYSKQGSFGGITVKTVRVARFHYDGEPPKPFCMKDGSAPPPPATKPGHTDGPTTTVRGKDVKNDPQTPQKVAPKPVKQEEKKPTDFQLEVEQAMQELFQVQWITTDPGKPDGINDAQTQAAVKDFQGKFHLDVDGIAGKLTRAELRKQRPAWHRQRQVQEELGKLFRGKKLTADPGPVTGTNTPETKAAVKELQGLLAVEQTGIPCAETQKALTEFLAGHVPTSEKPGLEPTVKHLYWVGNSVAPGAAATLRLHSRDLIVGQTCPILLSLEGSEERIAATVSISIAGTTAEAAVPIPAQFGPGAKVMARVTAALADEGELEANTAAPLYVRGTAQVEPADWRPYIGKGELPQEIVDAITRNRARYPEKKFTAASGGPKNAYAGPHKWDYKPPAAHAKWAKAHFQKKVDAATPQTLNAARAFMVMLNAEGRPASMQTYDNQIVTWGVGLGAKGDGVHAFTHLNKDADMKRLLDGLGINYFDHDYHVVDLRTKKVVSSAAGRKGDDNRHIVALEAWRQQKDLLSAIIGISEDPATREQVAESQYAVYLSNSASWPGQDKVLTLALYFMIAHMFHWMPALAKYGFNVEKLFQATGASAPSKETDKAIALQVARAFVAKAKAYFAKRPASYEDIRNRTKTRLWKKLKDDGKAEGFDPGELTYED